MHLSLKLRSFCIGQIAIVTTVIVLAACAYAFSKVTGNSGVFGFIRLLDVGDERSIPTYVSVVNLLLSSILLLIIYYHERGNLQDRSGYWGFLSFLFLLLSVDESAGIHENFAKVHQYLVANDIIRSTLNSHEWLPYGLFFVLVVSIVLIPFLRNLPTDTRRYFLIAGCVFIAGALGFEYLGAVMLEAGLVDSREDTVYLVRRLFEEGCEMYGIVIFNCALYRELHLRKVSIVVNVT